MIYLKGLSSREHASLHVFCSRYLNPITATRVLLHVYFLLFLFALFIYFKANWVVSEEQPAGPCLHVSPRDQNEVTGFSLIIKEGGFPKGASGV